MINPNAKKTGLPQWQCYLLFALLVLPIVFLNLWLETRNRLAFHLVLFFNGWLTYTFFEYIAHRFWMHAKEKRQPGKSLKRHMHHHTHPAELKITKKLRARLLSGSLFLLACSAWTNNYFTIFAGFYTGFVYYCFIHYFLHQPWAGRIFRGLQISHIHHHCKYPDRCFATCVTWWDKLFNTDVPWETRIPQKVIEFYFGRDHGHEKAA